MQVQSINYSHPVLFDSLHISVFVFLFELIRKEKISTATVTFNYFCHNLQYISDDIELGRLNITFGLVLEGLGLKGSRFAKSGNTLTLGFRAGLL